MSDTEKGAAARKKERPTKNEEKDQKKTDKKVKDKDKVKQEKDSPSSQVKKKIQGQSTRKKNVEDESDIDNEISEIKNSIVDDDKQIEDIKKERLQKKDKLNQLKLQKSQKLKAKEEEDTSKKYIGFVSGPMGDKVTKLPGIGPASEDKLREKGFTKAWHVLGQFLECERTGRDFKEWLKKETGANEKQREGCYGCLKHWCDKFLF